MVIPAVEDSTLKGGEGVDTWNDQKVHSTS